MKENELNFNGGADACLSTRDSTKGDKGSESNRTNMMMMMDQMNNKEHLVDKDVGNVKEQVTQEVNNER